MTPHGVASARAARTSEKERLLRALAGQTVDRVPFIGPGGMMTVATIEVMDEVGYSWPEAHSDPVAMAHLGKGMHDMAGFENFGVPFCLTVEAETMGVPVDLGTRDLEPRIANYVMDDVRDVSRLKEVEPRSGNRVEALLEAIRLLSVYPDVPITGNLTGPTTLAMSVIDPFEFAKAMRTDPAGAHALLAFLTENLIHFGKAQLAAGADVIVIADPSGTGEILGPDVFRAFALPYINRITEGLGQGYEKRSIVHICGRVQSIVAELAETRSSGLSVDSVVSIRSLSRRLTDKVLIGNVSTQLLDEGPEERITRAGVKCIDDGVGVLSPACGIGARTRLDHLRALALATKEWRA
jgi:MtaA/CmuA family methyltransferase